MKKFVGTMMVVILLLMAVCATAEVTIYWNTEVTGIEITEGELEFKEEGYDFEIIVIESEPVDEIKMEKNIFRFTDDENCNYNKAYAIAYDKYGIAIDDGCFGNLGIEVANCRTKNNAQVVNQLKDYLEKNYERNFEMYVFENK